VDGLGSSEETTGPPHEQDPLSLLISGNKKIYKTVTDGFKKVDDRFEKVDEQIQGVNERLDGQQKEMRDGFEKVDERFEKVDQQFNGVDERFKKIETDICDGFQNVEQRFQGVNEQLHGINQRLGGGHQSTIDKWASPVSKAAIAGATFSWVAVSATTANALLTHREIIGKFATETTKRCCSMAAEAWSNCVDCGRAMADSTGQAGAAAGALADIWKQTTKFGRGDSD
jgi:predicted  nucleic acid-binding Zn-ribbon protein